MRGRELLVAGAIVLTLVGVVLIVLNLGRADERAVMKLPEEDRATFVRAECESVRALCKGPELPPACVDRASLLLSVDHLDEGCRALCASITAPRR